MRAIIGVTVTVSILICVALLLSCTTFEADPVSKRFDENFSGNIPPVADIDPPGTDSFTFAVLSDTHIGSPGGKILDGMLQRIKASGDAFVISCGDNTDSGEEGQFSGFHETFSKYSLLYRAALGNHDIFFDGWKRFQRIVGRSMYSFNADNVHFTVIDSANGVFGEKQLGWLESDLSAATQQHKIVVTHFPVWNGSFTSIFKLANEEEAALVKDMFSRHNVTIMFAGHYHGYNEAIIGGVKYIVTGGANDLIDPGNKQHYFRVTVNGASIVTEKMPFP